MPGHTRQELSLINSKVDMYNKYQHLMQQVYDCLLLFQPNVYIICSPTPTETPSVIRVQIIWDSKSCEKYVSFSRALRASEDYDHVIMEIKTICAFAFQDSQELGNSPYYDLIYGVNCLDEL